MNLLPDEIIRHILEFNADFHPNLLACHKEMLKDPPYYWKKVCGGFKPGISDHVTWCDFKRKGQIRMDYNPTMPQWNEYLYLYAIEISAAEITPKNGEYSSRNIYLYYGWKRRKNFNHIWYQRWLNSFGTLFLGTY